MNLFLLGLYTLLGSTNPKEFSRRQSDQADARQTQFVSMEMTVRDTDSTVIWITPTILQKYFAVRKDLNRFWMADTSKRRRDASTPDYRVRFKYMIPQEHQKAEGKPAKYSPWALNYVKLASADTEIAAIFHKHEFPPEQFEQMVLALGWFRFIMNRGWSLSPTDTIGHNVQVLQMQKENYIQALCDMPGKPCSRKYLEYYNVGNGYADGEEGW